MAGSSNFSISRNTGSLLRAGVAEQDKSWDLLAIAESFEYRSARSCWSLSASAATLCASSTMSRSAGAHDLRIIVARESDRSAGEVSDEELALQFSPPLANQVWRQN